jgi:hypothetical protein
MDNSLDDVMTRATMHNILRAARRAQLQLVRGKAISPAFLIVTEADQIVVYDKELAERIGDRFAKDANATSVVLQILGVYSKPPAKPQAPKLLPPPSGEPPDGRVG